MAPKWPVLCRTGRKTSTQSQRPRVCDAYNWSSGRMTLRLSELLTFLFTLESDAKYCDERVCVWLCLCVCLHVSQTIFQTSRNFLCMLYTTVAQCFSDDTATRYVLPVLRMTSCFHTTGGILHSWSVRRKELFTTTHQAATLNCAPGTKSAIAPIALFTYSRFSPFQRFWKVSATF